MKLKWLYTFNKAIYFQFFKFKKLAKFIKGQSSRLHKSNRNLKRCRSSFYKTPSLFIFYTNFTSLPYMLSYFLFNQRRLCFFYFFRNSANIVFAWKQVSTIQVPLFSYLSSPTHSAALTKDNFNIVYLLQLKTNTKFYFLKKPTQQIPKISRAFGSFSILKSSNSYLNSWLVSLPSGLLTYFSIFSSAITLPYYFYYSFKVHKNLSYSAGTSYKLGFRPKVRGIAKNPVDHPHGGRTNSIKSPRTPWGLPTRKGK